MTPLEGSQGCDAECNIVRAPHPNSLLPPSLVGACVLRADGARSVKIALPSDFFQVRMRSSASNPQ